MPVLDNSKQQVSIYFGNDLNSYLGLFCRQTGGTEIRFHVLWTVTVLHC